MDSSSNQGSVLRRWRIFAGICAFVAGSMAAAAPIAFVKGFTLTEIGDHRYDASLDMTFKTEAQLIVDRLFEIGVRHVNLSPRAVMTDPRQSFIVPMTPDFDQATEKDRYLRLIQYIHGRGMTVGIRPIFFVVDASGNIPFVEPLPGGGEKVWWHGNIQPMDPAAWFSSFQAYHDIYLAIAREARAEEYTIGAELQSMTVGIGAEWPTFPRGFPGQWLALLDHARTNLVAGTRVVYDINYTDAEVVTGAGIEYGAEIIVWRQRLVDEANPADPELNQAWQNLMAFWKGLDAVGIDMYRSLAAETDVLPVVYEDLVKALRVNTDGFAAQLDELLGLIAGVAGAPKTAILKELGYRSIERGFIDPFNYAGPGTLNIEHQAAAYDAVLASFAPGAYPWFAGAVFWDASVDMERHGPFDNGFSPIGKELTENVVRRYFGSP